MIRIACCANLNMPDTMSVIFNSYDPAIAGFCQTYRIQLVWDTESENWTVHPIPEQSASPVSVSIGVTCPIGSLYARITLAFSITLPDGCNGGGESTSTLTCDFIGLQAVGALSSECCPSLPPTVFGLARIAEATYKQAIPFPQDPCACSTPPMMGGTPPVCSSQHPIRYSTGEIVLQSTDIATGGFGVPWGHTRTFASRLSWNENVGNGYNWQIAEWPYLVQLNNGTIVIMGRANDAAWFDWSEDRYVPRFTVKDALVRDESSEVYRLTSLDGSFIEFDEVLGTFTKQQDAFGNTLVVTGMAANEYNLTGVQRTYSDGGETVIEQFSYEYATLLGEFLLTRCTLRRQRNGGAWENVSRVEYTYYGSGNPYGGPSDLQTVATQSWQSSEWRNTGTTYYRYYRQLTTASSSSSSSSSSTSSGAATGVIAEVTSHLLKFVVNPASYARLAADPNVGNPLTATDGIVAQYADYYYEYDELRRVTREMVQGGSRNFTFAYIESAFTDDYNNWRFKTVEKLPDDSQVVVYNNFAGQAMLQVHQSGEDKWCKLWKYDSNGKVVLNANPSAISGFSEQYADLLHGVGGNYEYLRGGEGLIRTYDIHAPTGSIISEKIQRGQFGICIRLRDNEYTPFYADGSGGSSSSSSSSGSPVGEPVYFLTRTAVYPDDGCGCDCNSSSSSSSASSCSPGNCCSNDGTRRIITIYDYTFYSGTTQIQQQTTTLPVIPVGQNGSGIAATNKQYFDSFGNLIWSMDERGL